MIGPVYQHQLRESKMLEVNNIINEPQLRQLFSGCGFVHAEIKKDKSIDWHKQLIEKRISLVLECVEAHEKPNRALIASILNLSMPTVDKYLAALIDDGEISKVLTGGRGKQAYFILKENN